MKSFRGFILSAALACMAASSGLAASGSGGPYLSDEPIPMKTPEEMPQRVPPLIEWGDDFLGTGNIPSGWELPTGAVWIPALWVYGDARLGLQHVDPGTGGEDSTSIISSATFNFNLKLSGTERFFMQITPLDKDGRFTSYDLDGGSEGFNNNLNAYINRLFFEGDFGEIFPNLDPSDSSALDFGFSIGRQPIFFQEGILVNDVMDSVSIVRDTVIFPNVVDTRFAILWAWGDVNRSDNSRDNNADLLGFVTESDFRGSTVAVDAFYLISKGADDSDGIFLGASAVQRIGEFNTAFYVNQSIALDRRQATVDDGTLLFGEVSRTPLGTHDLVYANAFWGIDNFSSASRGETNGGPIGRVGLLFASSGIGTYPAALGNGVEDAVGGAVGYQMLFNDEKTQVVGELGFVETTDDGSSVQNGIGAGIRFQHKFAERYLFQVDGFVADRERADETYGIKTEWRVQF